MLTEAGAQGNAGVSCDLGVLLMKKREDIDGAEAAYRAAIAADPGAAEAHSNLGILLKNERKDIDGAKAAFHAVIAADPGDADAHVNLGGLLQIERQDIDGAEAAYVARGDWGESGARRRAPQRRRPAVRPEGGHRRSARESQRIRGTDAGAYNNLGVLFSARATQRQAEAT